MFGIPWEVLGIGIVYGLLALAGGALVMAGIFALMSMQKWGDRIGLAILIVFIMGMAMVATIADHLSTIG